VVWLVSLYSYGTFALASRSKGAAFCPEPAAITHAE
jgi:hypothetical protein